MKQFTVITKEGCGPCQALKNVLKVALNGEYDDKIEYVSAEESGMLKVAEFEGKSFPFIVDNTVEDRMLWGTASPTAVKDFLDGK